MFDPVHLRTFLAVAETLSFTGAGARLGISQPTVSQHVRRLEDSAGRQLLSRDTRTVTLTDNG
ncbi:helix-turn-helix domain-containing protein, partial [Phytoactinopolyspora endophytica]|uniref:helix-turn-helix domain-containing protein n=1 Tax=Phytoactinopolyspora endophytica TaxID=1642495 RepID=UPI00197BB57C